MAAVSRATRKTDETDVPLFYELLGRRKIFSLERKRGHEKSNIKHYNDRLAVESVNHRISWPCN